MTGADVTIRPGEIVDHFRVMRPLGEGGMGRVFLARDLRLGRKVAIKVVLPRFIGSDEAVRRFLHEARTTARFSHPHIVAIHHVGEHRGCPYVALEYLEGGTLRDRMAPTGMGLREAARLVLPIAQALETAHEAGVLHRDLKPENVVIPRDGRLRVVDFGLAKAANPDRAITVEHAALAGPGTPLPTDPLAPEAIDPVLTREDAIVGTPAYMAPEQYGGEATRASDVWALGTILCELIAGQRPFDGPGGIFPAVMRMTQGDFSVPEGLPPGAASLIRRCLSANADERPTAAEVAGELEVLLSPHARGRSEDSPFPGLLAFGEQDADLFFGRDAETAALLEALRDRPVAPLVGPSGAGKSSLIFGGLIPRLREQGDWTVLTVRPGARPFATLASQLLRRGSSAALNATVEQDLTDVRTPGDAMTGALDAALSAHPRTLTLKLQAIAKERGTSVLLVVDQLEELYTLVDDPAVRRRFMAAICTAADDVQDPVRVVFTLRDDFLGRVAEGAEVRRVLGQVMVLRPPDRDALQEVLVGPLRLRGYDFDDPDIVSEMVAATEGKPACLPMLQFAGRMLWDARDRDARRLTRAAYTAIGGVEGALAVHADEVLSGLPPASVRAARELLLRLVTPERTRRVVARDALIGGLDQRADEVLDVLVQSRLVALRRGRGGDADTRVELAHESLVTTWDQLARWLDAGREELRFAADVGQAAALWIRRGRPGEEVWAGDALAEALRTADRLALRLSDDARAFLDAGRTADHRVQGRRRRLRVGGLAALVLAALGSGLLALEFADREQRARTAQGEAERREAESLLEGAAAALQRGDVIEARAKTRRSFEIADATATRALWWRLEQEPEQWAFTAGGTINDMELSPDGSLAALALSSDRAVVVALATQEIQRVLPASDQVISLAWSPDGSRLVGAVRDGVIALWDVTTGTRRTLARLPAGVVSIAWSPDGRTLAAGTQDASAVLVEVATGETTPAWWGERVGQAWGAAWSPDARFAAFATTAGHAWIARGPDDIEPVLSALPGPWEEVVVADNGDLLIGGASLWVARPGEPAPRRSLTRHAHGIRAIASSPDGELLATGDLEGRIVVWATANDAVLADWSGHGDSAVTGLGFQPDGTLISAGKDTMVHAWRPERSPPAPAGHTGKIGRLAWSPDGQRLASGGHDGYVHLWDPGSGDHLTRLGPERQWIAGLDFDSSGARLVAAAKKVTVWDLATRTPAQEHRPPHGGVGHVLFSPGDDGFVSVDALGTVARLGADFGPRGAWTVAKGSAQDARLSPDGAWLAHGSGAHAVLLKLRTGTGRTLHATGGRGDLRGVAFAPDSLYATGADGLVHRWSDGQTDSEVVLDAGVRSYFLDVDPSGRRLAVPGADGLVRLLDLRDGGLTLLPGHAPGEAYTARFDPTGRWVATGGEDGAVRLWEAETGRPAWRAPLVRTDPPEIVTHRGWIDLGSGAPVEETAAWRHAVLGRALRAREHGDTVCVATATAVEIWSTREDRQLATIDGAVDGIDAGRRRCFVQVGGTLSVVGAEGVVLGAERVVLDRVRTVQADGDQLRVHRADEVVILDRTGQILARAAAPITSAASLQTDAGPVIGHRDGAITLVVDGAPIRLAPRVSSPVRSLARGPRGTLLVGRADGTVDLWEPRTGLRLASFQLHGPVHAIVRDGDRRHLATELGDTLTIDLRALATPYCALLPELLARTPWTWRSGAILRAPAEGPAATRCSATPR